MNLLAIFLIKLEILIQNYYTDTIKNFCYINKKGYFKKYDPTSKIAYLILQKSY